MTSELMTQADGIRRREEVLSYCRRLRNRAKRQYAHEYGAWREYVNNECEPRASGLSFMGAQAVRIEIDAIRSKWGNV